MNCLYTDLTRQDVFSKVGHLLDSGRYFRRADGKIDWKRNPTHYSPWLFSGHTTWQNCHLWHKILFDVMFEMKWVPSPCFECYKVVAMPRNVVELFAIHEMQLELNFPGKCGTEGDRVNTNRLYGAYWYNKGIEEGRVKKQIVIDAIKAHKELPDDLPVILKRGCTEFEQHCGPSDTWVIGDGQLELEKEVEATFAEGTNMLDYVETENYRAYQKVKWLHKAHQWGDLSYVKFTEGRLFFNPPVTY